MADTGKQKTEATASAEHELSKQSIKRKRDMIGMDGNKMAIAYCIYLESLPEDWTTKQIHDFISDGCGETDSIEIMRDEENFTGVVKLGFTNMQRGLNALESLKSKNVKSDYTIKVNGTTCIVASIHGSSDTDDSDTGLPPVVKRERKEVAQWEPKKDVWATDPSGLYGLKLEFLESLQIKPPLSNWVTVNNFRCDRIMLREMMELAGNIRFCSVKMDNYTANVMFNHPLEAVQAVSMFDKQKLHGKELSVKMPIVSPDIYNIVPNGFTNLGPGLGANGRPLNDIVRHFTKFSRGQENMINKNIFIHPDDKEFNNAQINIKKESPSIVDSAKDSPASENGSSSRNVNDENQLKSPYWSQIANQNKTVSDSVNSSYKENTGKTIATLVNRPVDPRMRVTVNVGPGPMGMGGPMPGPRGPIPGPRGPIPGPRGPIPGPRGRMPGPGPMMGPVGPMPGPSGPIPFPNGNGQGNMWNAGYGGPMGGAPMGGGPMPGSGWANAGPVVGPMYGSGQGPGFGPGNPSSCVELSNLPPNTTFTFLCEQLSQVGQVLSLQFTTQGCAVVRFANPIQAQQCFQKYDNMLADGYVIKVAFV